VELVLTALIIYDIMWRPNSLQTRRCNPSF